MPVWVAVGAVAGLAAIAFGIWLDAQRPEWFYSRRAFQRPVVLPDPPDPADHWVPGSATVMWLSPEQMMWLSPEQARDVERRLLGRPGPGELEGRDR